MDSNALKLAATTIARNAISAALGGIGVWASSKGLDTELALLVGAAAAFLVNVLWGIGERLLRKWKTTAALDVSTVAQLDKAVAETPMLTRLVEATQVPMAEKK